MNSPCPTRTTFATALLRENEPKGRMESLCDELFSEANPFYASDATRLIPPPILAAELIIRCEGDKPKLAAVIAYLLTHHETCSPDLAAAFAFKETQ